MKSEDIMNDFSLLLQQITAQLKDNEQINAIFDSQPATDEPPTED